jgi:hypothetical protein
MAQPVILSIKLLGSIPNAHEDAVFLCTPYMTTPPIDAISVPQRDSDHDQRQRLYVCKRQPKIAKKSLEQCTMLREQVVERISRVCITIMRG